MLEKTTLAIIGLIISGITFAGDMGPICAPGNLTVPCQTRAWSLGLEALYLKPILGTARAYRYATPSALVRTNDDWSWGYRAEGTYAFSTGQDINFNWIHFTNWNSAKPGFITIFSPELTEPYLLTTQNSFDRVNVLVGQTAALSLVNTLHFYGGLQYTHINQQATNSYPLPLPFPVTNSGGIYDDNADFKGVGPVAGVNFQYTLFNDLSMIANAATSVLYGSTRLTTGYTLYPENLVLGLNYWSKKIVTPGFEARLGLNYGRVMSQGIFNIEVGYQIVEYYNVLQGQALQNPTSPIAAVNFGLYGPYVGLKYKGDV